MTIIIEENDEQVVLQMSPSPERVQINPEQVANPIVLVVDASNEQVVLQPDGEVESAQINISNGEGPPGPPGPPGSSAPFILRQLALAASWTVDHNLGYKPQVSLFLDEDPTEQVHTDIDFIDDNTFIVIWPSPVSGWAYAR